jgi:hypothetical protein
MKNAVEMASGGMIYIASAMKVCTGIKAIKMFPFNNLRGCNIDISDLGEFMKYIVETNSGGVICILSLITINSGIQKFLGGYTYRHTDSKMIS